MTDKKIIKCDKCSVEQETYSPLIKGPNNTKLCVKCGESICFICGKKETKKEWIEDVDCCGNKIMVEGKIKMFCQTEKEENNPNEEIFVHYCDQHRAEAQKSPYLFTEAEREVYRQRKEKEWYEKCKQEKRKRQERLDLNKQKNLFFCDGWTNVDKNGQKYGAFLGKQNGQKYSLMVPFDHPIWKNLTDPAVKRVTEVFWWDGNDDGFFVVDGVENIPMEKSPSDCWKNKRGPIFHKLVALSDKITFMEAEKQGKPEKNKPVENKPNNENISVILNSVKEYFQKNDIKSIKLVGEKWIVEYNHNQKNNEYPISSAPASEFQELKNYFQATNKNEITLADLEKNTNSTNPSQNSPDNKILVGCIFGGIGLLIMGVVISFIFKKKKVKKN